MCPKSNQIFDIEKIITQLPVGDKTLTGIFLALLAAIIITSFVNVQISLVLIIPLLLTLLYILLKYSKSSKITRQLETINRLQTEFVLIDFKLYEGYNPYVEYKRKQAVLSRYENCLFLALDEENKNLASELKSKINEIKSEIVEIEHEMKNFKTSKHIDFE